MWPYVLAFIAVAVFPFALAGVGGHLAAIALPENLKKKQKLLRLVWGLAIAGIVVAGVSEVATYRSDRERDGRDEGFRTSVLAELHIIADEPNQAKRKEDATALEAALQIVFRAPLSNPFRSLAKIPQPAIIQPPIPVQQPDQVAPISCSPRGTLSGWVITIPTSAAPTQPPFAFNSIFQEASPLQPLLRRTVGRQQKVLEARQIEEISSLLAELNSRLSLPQKPGVKDVSPVSIEELGYSTQRYDSGYVEVTKRASGPLGVTTNVEKILISSLSDSARHAMADFDALSKIPSDNQCKDAPDQNR